MEKGYFWKCFAKNSGAGRCGNVAKWHLKIPQGHVALLMTTRLNWYKHKSAAELSAQSISFYGCVDCVCPCTCVSVCVRAPYTQKEEKHLVVDIGHFRISALDLWHFKSFRSSLISKGRVVNKHCCAMALLGPRETLWLDGQDIDWHILGAPAQRLWSKVDRARLGGGGAAGGERRCNKDIRKHTMCANTHTHMHAHNTQVGFHWSPRDRGWDNDFLSALSHAVSNNQSSVIQSSISVPVPIFIMELSSLSAAPLKFSCLLMLKEIPLNS